MLPNQQIARESRTPSSQTARYPFDGVTVVRSPEIGLSVFEDSFDIDNNTIRNRWLGTGGLLKSVWESAELYINGIAGIGSTHTLTFDPDLLLGRILAEASPERPAKGAPVYTVLKSLIGYLIFKNVFGQDLPSFFDVERDRFLHHSLRHLGMQHRPFCVRLSLTA